MFRPHEEFITFARFSRKIITNRPENATIHPMSQFAFLGKETQRLESIYERKLAAVQELKRSLLQQAFNGELIQLRPS